MDAVIHLTDPGPEHWRRAKARADLLNEPEADVDRVTLIAELDAATSVIDGAEFTEEVVESFTTVFELRPTEHVWKIGTFRSTQRSMVSVSSRVRPANYSSVCN